MTPSTTNTAAREVVLPDLPTKVSAYEQITECNYERDGCDAKVHIFSHPPSLPIPADTETVKNYPLFTSEQMYLYARKAIATLTQQQGGEQEAGDVEKQARELLYAETAKAYAEPFGGPIIQHDIAIRAISAALRSKQPAASEGDQS